MSPRNLPARGYSWPPFQPGNQIGLRHGAFSPRRLEPLADELLERAIGSESYLAEPDYRPALEAWARAEARCILVAEWLAENGILDGRGRPRPAADYAIRLERLASEHRARLGLDPLSRARLGRDVTSTKADLARLWAEQARQEADDAG